MPVTLVIPTYNRSGKILETLDALAEQDYRDFKVLVVDDGSSDNTQAAVLEKKTKLPFALEYIRQDNAGASAATNRGVAQAAEGLIILLDDDILPAPQTIGMHVAFHRTHPGSILSGSADTDPSRSVTDVQRYKLYMEQEWKKIRPDAKQLIRVDFSNFIITTANMSFPREVFTKLGGFDVQLRDGYDVDFGFRALLNQVPLYFDGTVKSIHNDQINLRYYARRQKAYMDSKRIIFHNNPELRKKIGTDFEQKVPPLKSFAYKILRRPLLVRFFESEAFPKILPRAFRYRIYGSTIAALSFVP